MSTAPKTKLLLATRGSPLALWQAETTKHLLAHARPDIEVELVVVQSSGDKDQKTDLSRLGRTGVFTAEIDEAILSGRAHAGVHSLKDMTTSLPDGLVLAGVLQRGAIEDALVARDGGTLDRLPKGARVATGSVRRVAMLKRARPDLEIVGIRGNVDTRLNKLASGQAEALLMACAGLERLGYAKHISERLGAPRFLPAVGQGIVGLTCRPDDAATLRALQGITDREAWAEAHAERALLAQLHGGCNAPVGALARAKENALSLTACVLSLDGTEVIEDRITGETSQAAELGAALAQRLNARGAKRLVEAARAGR
ncbi:MAG: hydroxymethylbilane synthase [Planctomycetes bacterium]|nr:hydroxymethylbilane synthase [Planctomycetota bacterium]